MQRIISKLNIHLFLWPLHFYSWPIFFLLDETRLGAQALSGIVKLFRYRPKHFSIESVPPEYFKDWIKRQFKVGKKYKQTQT